MGIGEVEVHGNGRARFAVTSFSGVAVEVTAGSLTVEPHKAFFDHDISPKAWDY